jgi:uncharacterized protein
MRALVGVLLLALAAPAAALEIPPRPESGLSDPGGVLAPADRARIEAQLEGYARGTTARYAVAIFPTLDDENTQDFGIRIFEAWKLGSLANKDGVLVTIYEREHKIRFDVGYGLEDKLPDIVCRHIIDEQIMPRFRAGDRVGGILAALAMIDHRVTGRAAVMPVGPTTHRHGDSDAMGLVLFLVIMIVLFALRARHGRRYGSSWPFFFWGGWGGGGGFGGGGFGGGGGGGGWSDGGGGSAGGGGADGGW